MISRDNCYRHLILPLSIVVNMSWAGVVEASSEIAIAETKQAEKVTAPKNAGMPTTEMLGGDVPINVEAVEAELRQTERLVLFKGDVVVSQGTMRLEANTVRAYYSEDGQSGEGMGSGDLTGRIERLEAEGNVRLQRPDQKVVAERAVYRMGDGKVILSGGVISQIRNNVVESEELVVDLNDNSVKLDAKPGDGRVRGIFVPETKNNAP